MICLNCGREIIDNSKFCEFCGKKVEKKNFRKFICNGCGKEINESSNFCEFCGKKVEKNIVNNIFCTKCGSKLDGGNFCTVCGTRINQIPSINDKEKFITNEKDNEISIKEEIIKEENEEVIEEEIKEENEVVYEEEKVQEDNEIVATEDTQEENEEVAEEDTQEENEEVAEEEIQEENEVVVEEENNSSIKDNFCTNCGSKLNGGNFCIICGTKIDNNEIKNKKNTEQDNKQEIREITNKEGKDIILNVTRQKKTMGFAVPFTVHVDDVVIGKLKNGSTISYNIKPGHHVVNIESVEKNTIEEIDVTESMSSIEIIVVAKMGFIAATAKLVDVIYK